MSGDEVARRGAIRLISGRDAREALRRACIVFDLVAVLAATFLAAEMRFWVAPLLGLQGASLSLMWPLAIPFVAVLGVFYSSGLYERDAFMSRPLHAWTIMRASLVAFVLSSAAAFLAGTGWINLPRLIIVLTFALFPLIDVLLRVGILDHMYLSWVRQARPVALVVGDSAVARGMAKRLTRMRGFDHVTGVTESSDAAEVMIAEFDEWPLEHLPAGAVFVDTSGLPPRQVVDVVETAQFHGADVYVISGLLGPLEGSALLNALFRAPVTRIRRSLVANPGYALKRALDLVGAAAILLLLSPVIGVLAAIIKATSDGPVFYTQTRVGLSGRTFEFLKFRSMYVNSDSTGHQQYVRQLIKGNAKPMSTDSHGNALFKIVDDPRITPVGVFIRRYSLDEIPQFINVLRGEMSLVGPRPPLPYEANEYDSWQQQRLEVQCGITGVWQVVGRNRVSFDEMTLQDLMYGMNQGLWVDLRLCVSTIPAALLGGGL